MIIYLAAEPMIFFPKKFGKKKNLKPPRLCSYHYKSIAEVLIEAKQSGLDFPLFLDSGAYSAKNLGVEISLDSYAEFILNNLSAFNEYANLDVIGDDKSSYKNYRKLQEYGLQPLPVFHFNNYSGNVKYLKKYITDTDHIAIGGGASKSQGWLDTIWNEYLTDEKGRPLCKVHGFGITTHSILIRYPWYSVDSTTWVMASSVGELCVPVYKRGELNYKAGPMRIGITPDSYKSSTNTFKKKHNRILVDYIESHGFKLGKSHESKVKGNHTLKENERWIIKGKKIRVIEEDGVSTNYIHRRWLNAIYFMNLQKYLTKNPVTFNKKQIRTKLF